MEKDIRELWLRLKESAKKEENALVISDIKNENDIKKMVYDLKNVKDGTTIYFFGNYPFDKLFSYIPNDKEVFIQNYGRKFNHKDLCSMKSNFWVYDIDMYKRYNVGAITQNVVVRPNLLLSREKFYADIFNVVKKNNLTPLETLIYVYSKVIFFKRPKEFKAKDRFSSEYVHESTSDWNCSKNTALIFSDIFMDCVGVCDLIIEAIDYINMPGLEVFGERVEVGKERIGHKINKIIVDDKDYGVKGTYFCDCTQDSGIMRNSQYQNKEFPVPNLILLSHFLLTVDEMQQIDRYDRFPEFFYECDRSKTIDGSVYAALLNKLCSIYNISNEKLNDFLFLSSETLDVKYGVTKYFGHSDSEKVQRYKNEKKSQKK